MRPTGRLLLRGWGLATALLLAAGCTPKTTSPITVWALALDSKRNYVPTEVQLTTVASVTALSGTAAKLVGGADIEYDPSDTLLSGSPTAAQVATAVLKNEGGSPKASYTTRAGVLYPMDDWSWNAVTLYANLEASYLYWKNKLDVTSTSLGQATVYLAPRYVNTNVGPDPLTDASFYSTLVHALVYQPFQDVTLAPTFINKGIVGHDYAERIFNIYVYGDALTSIPDAQWQGLQGLRAIHGVENAAADFHGYLTTCSTDNTQCDADYLALTYGEAASASRNFSTTAASCLTMSEKSFLDNPGTKPDADYFGEGHDFVLGSAIAGALYEAGLSLSSLQDVGRALVASYADTNQATPGLAQTIDQYEANPDPVTLSLLANVIAMHFPDGTALKNEVCLRLRDHLLLTGTDDLPTCPAWNPNDPSVTCQK